MNDPAIRKPNAGTAWTYRLVPNIPKSMRPKNMIILHHTGRRSGSLFVPALGAISLTLVVVSLTFVEVPTESEE
jgi:hypothetical protein